MGGAFLKMAPFVDDFRTTCLALDPKMVRLINVLQPWFQASGALG